jgi:hypothetical protein
VLRDDDGHDIAPVGRHALHIETRDSTGHIGGRYVPRNYDLFGAQAGPANMEPDWLVRNGIRHGRTDFPWGEFEPRPGRWDLEAFRKFGEKLALAKRYDMTLLPMLCGAPAWAAADGKGGWKPARDVSNWTRFVDKIVGHYSRPPYLQQHWQVWNEAPAGPFWPGDLPLEVYIEKVHNPAARAIRKHFVDRNGNGLMDDGERCLVVWGGWPASHWQGGQYRRALEIGGAGELTDILDGHYMQGLRWFEDTRWSGDVYSKWIRGGRAVGCWQTEMGHGFATNPVWLPQTFFQDLGWALAHDWNRKDRYRNYFFHYYAAQPRHGFYWDSDAPRWPNGYSIRTLMRVTRGDLTLPGPSRKILVEQGTASFADSMGHLTLRPLLAGGRLVFLFRPDESNADGKASVRITLKPGEEARSVTRVTLVQGVETAVRFSQHERALVFELPWKPSEFSAEKPDHPLSPTCYVVVACDKPMDPE